MPRFRRGESDALGVKKVDQLGGTEADACGFQTLLELRQDQRLVLQDLSVQAGVGQDEGAHGLQAIFKAGGRLGSRYPAIAV